MILVVGATGQLGGLIARTLLDHGKPVRILVRSGSSYGHLVAAGAQPVTGDLKDADSLAACCTGVEAIVSTANSAGRGGDDTVESVDRQGNRNLIDAAAAAGVRHFVFTSVLGASPDSPVPFVRAKGETEQRLHDSGDRAATGRLHGYVGPHGGRRPGARRPVRHPRGRRPTPPLLSRHAGRRCLRARRAGPRGQGSNPAHRRPEAGVVVGRHSGVNQELGREIPVRTVQPGQPVPGLPDVVAELLAMMDPYDSPIDSSELASTYGVTPTSLAEFVRGFLASNRHGVG